MHFMRKKKNPSISCLNKTCLSRGGCWHKEPLAGRLCRTRGKCSPHLKYLQVSPVPWVLGADVKHIWSLVPSVLCLSQPAVTTVRLPSCSETSWSWKAAVPCRCCVPQTLQVLRPGCWVGPFTSSQLDLTVSCPQAGFLGHGGSFIRL